MQLSTIKIYIRYDKKVKDINSCHKHKSPISAKLLKPKITC